MDVDRLVSVLKLMDSPHDGEALAAARRAAAMLRKSKIAWHQVIKGATAPKPVSRPVSQGQRNAVSRAYLERLLKAGKFRTGLDQQWIENQIRAAHGAETIGLKLSQWQRLEGIAEHAEIV